MSDNTEALRQLAHRDAAPSAVVWASQRGEAIAPETARRAIVACANFCEAALRSGYMDDADDYAQKAQIIAKFA